MLPARRNTTAYVEGPLASTRAASSPLSLSTAVNGHSVIGAPSGLLAAATEGLDVPRPATPITNGVALGPNTNGASAPPSPLVVAKGTAPLRGANTRRSLSSRLS